ncbi:MAG: ribonuclease E/G, partial [Pontimonas sp.]|nr:ribonuclease E/G [Pontimonas sp.]
MTRKKEDDSKPEKKAPAAKKAAAEKPVKKAPAAKKEPKTTKAVGAKAEKPVAQTTTSLVFQAPDPGLFPTWTPGSETSEGDKVVRRRSRANRKPLVEEKKASESADSGQPQKVRGSTRLEAKRQRRRDGREGSRRRGTVTETEFLARRESVDRVMVVRETTDRTQIAVLEDNVVVEHYVARSEESSLIGNVYLGRVQNVLPSMEAAFVDIGRGRNAVLYSGEVDWEAAAEGGATGPRRIELALKTGDTVLVQVTKDPVGHKGARLTSQISLPGRYLVY